MAYTKKLANVYIHIKFLIVVYDILIRQVMFLKTAVCVFQIENLLGDLRKMFYAFRPTKKQL